MITLEIYVIVSLAVAAAFASAYCGACRCRFTEAAAVFAATMLVWPAVVAAALAFVVMAFACGVMYALVCMAKILAALIVILIERR